MLQEGDQAGRHAHHLARSHVDVLDRIGGHEHEVAAIPRDDRLTLQLAVDHRGIGRSKVCLMLLVGPQPDDVVSELALRHLAVRRDEKPVGIDARIDRQARDQTDVRAFRRFDRADAAVVGDVHVAHLEAGPLAIETARAERREPPLVREHRKRIGLIDHLREFATAEEILDRRRDALRIDERAGRHVGDVLETHPLLHGAAELEEALAELVAGQFVDRAQAAVAEVVDIVDLDLALALAELQHVFDGCDQIVGTKRHLRLGHGQTELAVDAKAAHAAKTIAVGVLELLVEERSRLVEGGRIARPQTLIDANQGVFVAGRHGRAPLRFIGILAEAVDDEGHLLLLHQLHGLEARRRDQFGLVVRDLAAGIDEDLAGPLAPLRIDDVIDRDLALDLGHTAAAQHLLDRRLVEELEDLGVAGVFRVHRPQERERRKLAALIDPHLQRVFLRHVELDPAATLRNDAAVVGLAVGRLGVGDKVDSGRAVQLAHHDSLGTVDDELTTAEHDRDVAEIDLFLDGLLASEPQQHAQRTAVRQPQLAAFVRIVARLAEFVPQILDLDGLVVALDREDFPKHTLDALVFPLVRSDIVLQEAVIKPGLNFGEVGNRMAGATAAEVTNFRGLKATNGASCH